MKRVAFTVLFLFLCGCFIKHVHILENFGKDTKSEEPEATTQPTSQPVKPKVKIELGSIGEMKWVC